MRLCCHITSLQGELYPQENQRFLISPKGYIRYVRPVLNRGSIPSLPPQYLHYKQSEP